jgi:hypothetical protein
MTALRTLFSLGEHIYDLEVVHNVHFLDITSLFDKQNAHWVKKKYSNQQSTATCFGIFMPSSGET